jgi:hypothetical protein
VQFAQGHPRINLLLSKFAPDLKMRSRDCVRRVPQVIVTKDPLVPIQVGLILEAGFFNLKKIRLRILIEI